MESNIYNIYNNNKKNTIDQSIYDSFNNFIFSNDKKILGKLLFRYDFYNKVKNLPGDIVEIGVFKGSGVATFSKILHIFSPNSIKQIIGFDIFDPEKAKIILDEKESVNDNTSMNQVYSRVNVEDRTLENVKKTLMNIDCNPNFELVEGDVEITLPCYIENNPGLRISLLYIDVDIERPTYIALKYLWDKVVPGGIIVLDEYEYHIFTESSGVDKFLKEFKMEYNLISTNWFAPTCYIQKNKFF
jgi:hypothetical protein